MFRLQQLKNLLKMMDENVPAIVKALAEVMLIFVTD